MRSFAHLAVLALLLACRKRPDETDTAVDTDADTDSDTDADTDSDTDADTDSDTDADTDTDTDTDPPVPPSELYGPTSGGGSASTTRYVATFQIGEPMAQHALTTSNYHLSIGIGAARASEAP